MVNFIGQDALDLRRHDLGFRVQTGLFQHFGEIGVLNPQRIV
jgi:hypothetical protein